MELFYKKCLFLTSSKPLDFTFSEDFRMSRDPIPLQIDVYGNSVAKKTWIWYISRTTILHFSMKYKFGGKHCSNFSRAVFMIFFFFFTFLTDHFWSFNAFLKNKYVKGNFWHSLGHKICRLFHVSAHFLFTTIETELNYYHQNESVRVASRVAEELRLRNLGSFKNILEMLVWRRVPIGVPSPQFLAKNFVSRSSWKMELFLTSMPNFFSFDCELMVNYKRPVFLR